MHKLVDNEIIEFAADNFSLNNSYFYILYLGQKEQVEYCRNEESKETFTQKLQSIQQNAEQILMQCKEHINNIHNAYILKKQVYEKQFAKDIQAYEEQLEEGKAAKGIDIEVLDKKYFDWS